MLRSILVVVIAILVGIYQIYLKPFLHLTGVGRVIESLGNNNCTTFPDLQACESGPPVLSFSNCASLNVDHSQKSFSINRQVFFTWRVLLPPVASNGFQQ